MIIDLTRVMKWAKKVQKKDEYSIFGSMIISLVIIGIISFLPLLYFLQGMMLIVPHAMKGSTLLGAMIMGIGLMMPQFFYIYTHVHMSKRRKNEKKPNRANPNFDKT